MSVKACRQELPNKGVKLTALRAAAYAQNVRPSKHDATSGLAKRLDKRRGIDRSRGLVPGELCNAITATGDPGWAPEKWPSAASMSCAATTSKSVRTRARGNASWLCHTAHAGGETD
jgi:hypothetical protein